MGNTIWLCFAEFDGTPCVPTVVATQWSYIAPYVYDKHLRRGLSIAVGFPTEFEARLCVIYAGCLWPSNILGRPWW